MNKKNCLGRESNPEQQVADSSGHCYLFYNIMPLKFQNILPVTASLTITIGDHVKRRENIEKGVKNNMDTTCY